VRLALLLLCALGCERASTPAPDPGDPGEAGACQAIEDRTVKGLVHAASDRHIRDLGGVEREARELLRGLCVRERWAGPVISHLADCAALGGSAQRRCTTDALAPVFAHKAQFDQIFERHK
jgi:hypothetical protein